MKVKIILFGFYIFMFLGCTKEKTGLYEAEGFVYEFNSNRPLSNVPIIMSECNHNGTRCIYSFVTKTFTDEKGFYKISGRPNKNGSISIEVGSSDKAFGTREVSVIYPNKVFKHDFFAYPAIYLSARFIVQTQNRNFVYSSIISSGYSAGGAVLRNPPNVYDTTLRLKLMPNSPVSLQVTLRNENGINIPSDSLIYLKDLSFITRDTSVLWNVP